MPKYYHLGGAKFKFEIILICMDMRSQSDQAFWNNYLDNFDDSNSSEFANLSSDYSFEKVTKKLQDDEYNQERQSLDREAITLEKFVSNSSGKPDNKETVNALFEDSNVKLRKKTRSDASFFNPKSKLTGKNLLFVNCNRNSNENKSKEAITFKIFFCVWLRFKVSF